MPFRALHINAAEADFTGNDGRGRYLLLPGSRSRAAAIAKGFRDVHTKTHDRGHDLHVGVLERDGLSLDIGVISTGMGCPSVDLIVTELIALGAKVMVRVGTCGSMQPHIHTGDVIAATAAVRDEGTTRHYLPPEVPAVPSFELVRAMLEATRKANTGDGAFGTNGAKLHFGPVHTKDSLYAREMGFGPLREQHLEYQRLLTKAGVLASEMECAQLFVLGALGPLAEATERVHTGAVLAVIGDHDVPFKESPRADTAVGTAIEFALDALVAFHRL
jgi:uridine phosphorylase